MKIKGHGTFILSIIILNNDQGFTTIPSPSDGPRIYSDCQVPVLVSTHEQDNSTHSISSTIAQDVSFTIGHKGHRFLEVGRGTMLVQHMSTQ